MKKTYYRAIMIGAILLAAAPALLAATTGQINYQARLLDAYGRRINATVSLAFKLYDAATDGNLLWSETQTGVVVSDGIYSVTLGSTTPIPASVFSEDGIYLELAINDETMAPRQLITSAGQALVARTVMGEDIFVNQSNGKVGIGTITPAEQLDVDGTIKVTGFKLPTGATANYVLMSDANGTGQWRPATAGMTETDPVFNAWSVGPYATSTGNLWTAVGNLNTATDTLNTAVGLLRGATNVLNSATNALNTHVVSLIGWTNAVIGATNVLNSATNALNLNKLNRVGGTAVNLTVTGAFYQAQGSNQSFAASGALVNPSNAPFMVITGSAAGLTVSIDNGSNPGQTIILQGGAGNAVTLTNGGKVALENGVNFTFKTNNTMQLIWNNNGVWAELHRAAQP